MCQTRVLDINQTTIQSSALNRNGVVTSLGISENGYDGATFVYDSKDYLVGYQEALFFLRALR